MTGVMDICKPYHYYYYYYYVRVISSHLKALKILITCTDFNRKSKLYSLTMEMNKSYGNF